MRSLSLSRLVLASALSLCVVSATVWADGARPGPQDDYYTYVNYDWLENTPIPETLPGLENFTLGYLDVLEMLSDDLSALDRQDAPLSPHEQKLVDLYRSYTDLEHRDKLGARPLDPEFELIAGAKDHDGVAKVFVELEKLAIGGPLVIFVGIDPKDSKHYTVVVTQEGLGPTQAVLVGDDERSQKMRALYQEHLANYLTLAGFPEATGRASRVVELEQALARIQWTPTQMRDPQQTYNLFTIDQLQKTLDNFPLTAMLGILGLPADRNVVVQQPTYLEALNKLFVETDVGVWQDYLRARVLSERATLLSKPFRDEIEANKVRKGEAAKALDFGLQSVLFLENEVDMLVGRFYIEHHFTDDDLAQITGIVNAIKEQYRLAITDSTFFSEATRKEALDKLENMRFYLGYPKKWKDYGNLEIDPGDLAGNVRRIALFDHQNMVDKLDKSVDPDEWLKSPTNVNAFYQPSANKFVLMAAILQPPFFNSEWSTAANMGGIGFVVGHEIGHGFDDQGSQYDAVGNLRNWWTPEDREKFIAVAKRAVAKADAYEILPGQYLNGKLELGEILGDLNGIHIANRANIRLAEAEGVDVDTANREFFEQAAQVWRAKYREAMAITLIQTDGHPPGEYRVNGIFPNLDSFQALYQVEPGDGMYLAPEDRLVIW